MSTVAVIGLGNMGAPIARRLIAAGIQVRGFDLSESARADLARDGGEACASPAEAVLGSRMVLLLLPHSGIVESVMMSAEVRAALGPATLVIDMSSSEPLRTRKLAQALAIEGVQLIDAPVSGGVSGATAGTLTIMVGGSDDDISRATEVLENFGTVRRAGSVGAGHAAKALNNLMSATHLLASSEAIIAGERFGVDPELLLAIVNGSSGRSGSTENKWPRFILPGTFDSGFSLALMLKDMRIAVDLADQVAAESRLGHAAVDLWAEAAAGLPTDADHTEVARWVAAAAESPERAQR